MFAKIFGPPHDQILVTLIPNPNRSPRLSVYRKQGQGRAIYQRYLEWEPTQEGWCSAEAHFETIDEKIARHLLSEQEHMASSEIWG